MKVVAVAFLFFVSPTLLAQTTAPHASLKEQKMCAQQAEKEFNAIQESVRHEGDLRNDYVSHFDPATKVCYIMTWHSRYDKSGKQHSFHSMVWDAYERRSYAEFASSVPDGEAEYAVKPSMCSLRPRNHKQIFCRDRDEYEELVEKWFGIRSE